MCKFPGLRWAQAFKEVFEGLDRCEVILEKQKYIAGKTLSEADIRLFVTLIRFDEVGRGLGAPGNLKLYLWPL